MFIDYSDVDAAPNNTTEIYMFESSGTSKDAYLYVTEGEVAVPARHVLKLSGDVLLHLKSGNLTIK